MSSASHSRLRLQGNTVSLISPRDEAHVICEAPFDRHTLLPELREAIAALCMRCDTMSYSEDYPSCGPAAWNLWRDQFRKELAYDIGPKPPMHMLTTFPSFFRRIPTDIPRNDDLFIKAGTILSLDYLSSLIVKYRGHFRVNVFAKNAPSGSFIPHWDDKCKSFAIALPMTDPNNGPTEKYVIPTDATFSVCTDTYLSSVFLRGGVATNPANWSVRGDFWGIVNDDSSFCCNPMLGYDGCLLQPLNQLYSRDRAFFTPVLMSADVMQQALDVFVFYQPHWNFRLIPQSEFMGLVLANQLVA